MASLVIGPVSSSAGLQRTSGYFHQVAQNPQFVSVCTEPAAMQKRFTGPVGLTTGECKQSVRAQIQRIQDIRGVRLASLSKLLNKGVDNPEFMGRVIAQHTRPKTAGLMARLFEGLSARRDPLANAIIDILGGVQFRRYDDTLRSAKFYQEAEALAQRALEGV